MKNKILVIAAILLLAVPACMAQVIPQNTWTLKYVDSQETSAEDGRAINAFDGNINTFWHTEWSHSNPVPPHEIQINMGKSWNVSGFRYLPRQDADGCINGYIGQYEFYVSTNGIDWGTPVVAGNFPNNSAQKEVTFTPKTGQYIKLKALKEIQGNPWTSAAEINVIGDSIIPPTPTPTPTPTPPPTYTTIPDWSSVTTVPFENHNPTLTASDVTDISALFIADPFIYHENGQPWYMFFEVLGVSGNYGRIGVAKSNDGETWSYDKIVLDEGYHHSYPLVFSSDGHYYMIPESYLTNSIRLYEASNFPYGWNYTATLVSGKDFVDASIFRYNGLWWMFVSTTPNNAVYAYYSDNLLSGWKEHPLNPIVTGSDKSRPAGRIGVIGNNLYRYAQKCDKVYGEAVRAFQVDTLTKTSYAEHEIPESPILTVSGSGWNSNGMHQFDPWWNGNKWLRATDGYDANGIWAIKVY